MRPRDYQLEAARQVRESWQRGGRPIVCLATGAGKTHVAGLVLDGARAPVAISHTTTLQEQIAARLPAVRSLTIQSLLEMGPARARAALQGTDRCAIDETHHYVPGSLWHRALAAALPAAALVVGFTATPARLDGAGLGGPGGFTDLVSTASYSSLLAAGHLAPCEVLPCPEMAGDPAAAYLSFARSRSPILGKRCGGAAVVALPTWRPGVLFTPTKAAAHAAVATLRAAGVRAVAIDADTTDRARRVAVVAFAAGELDVLASPMALSEGFDSPRAEVCVLDRACLGLGLYLQTAGRVLRPYPGKESALLLDCRGAAARHGSPTDDRVYSLVGEGIRSWPRVREPITGREKASPRPATARLGSPAAPPRLERTAHPPHDRERFRSPAPPRESLVQGLRSVWSWFWAA